MNPQEPQDYSKPVAYDNQGRPLYAHPPAQAQQPAPSNEPQRVYISRPLKPEKAEVTPEVRALHEQSRKQFPRLNISEGEYVISAVKRHWIGLVKIWFFVFATILAFGAVIILFFMGDTGSNSFFGSFRDRETLESFGIALMLMVTVLAILGGMVATYVYQNNRFFLTNESVIQEIQTSLFARHEQTVSLINIEDASYEQNGILPHMLNYGRIRLSTEGDETTYRFNYVSNPHDHIAKLNNAVEAFKNGRPVHD